MRPESESVNQIHQTMLALLSSTKEYLEEINEIQTATTEKEVVREWIARIEPLLDNV